MRQVIVDLLLLRAQNSHPMVYLGLAFIYLVMVVSTITSIAQENFGGGKKSFFVLLVLAVPLLGMLVYTVSCIWRADHSAILRFKPQRKK